MAKLTKKAIAAARKKVPPSQWQKRGLKTAWAIQKRGQKGGKRKSPAKKKPAKRKSPARGGNPTSNSNRKPKIGASYQAARAGAGALSPVTDTLIPEPGAGDIQARFNRLRSQVEARPSDLIAHEIVVGADVAVDKKMGQAAAISRGSLTAIAPEAYTGWQVWNAPSGQNAAQTARLKHKKWMKVQYGYDPVSNTQNFVDDPDTRTYRLIKHGGQLVRFARRVSFIKRMTEPVQKLLGMVGLSI